MTSNVKHKDGSHAHQSNGIGANRPSWRSGSVHVDIDAFDMSMDIGHRSTKTGSNTVSVTRSTTGNAGMAKHVPKLLMLALFV